MVTNFTTLSCSTWLKHIKHVKPVRQIASVYDKTTPIYFFTCVKAPGKLKHKHRALPSVKAVML